MNVCKSANSLPKIWRYVSGSIVWKILTCGSKESEARKYEMVKKFVMILMMWFLLRLRSEFIKFKISPDDKAKS